MEMRGVNKNVYKWLKACYCILVFLLVQQAHAQVPVKNYSIKDGKMYIALGKDLQTASLDSFIEKHDLYDLDLQHFIKTGSQDSLIKLGWKIDIDNKEICIISKPLFSSDNISNPADKIIFTQKDIQLPRFPNTGSQVHFGYNRFKNKMSFAVADSMVSFFLKGNTKATQVSLAGSFNNWQPGATPMVKTDSGWIANIKLGAGKYWYKFVIDDKWTLDRDNALKENDGMGNDNSVYYKTNFSFKLEGYTQAKRVFVAGSFNDWKERDLLMERSNTGWNIPVYLSEGTHTYRFIADGKWFTDPHNNDKLPNEFDEFNSVIRMGNPYIFTLDGYTDAKKVVLLGSFNNWKDNELVMNKTFSGWELPYTLGPGNYEYKIKADNKFITDPVTKENKTLVIDPNFTFRLKGYENAKTVFLAGDLNNWNPASFQMKREGDEWLFKAHLNKGKHRYKFVVDGKWILDPANKLWEQNEYKTGNSVLWINTD
ncbi:MAG: hypothetical protein IPL50_15035 [Chitinophagaceae bacterium]|nr:hypothetical protein [Chitinophagaceae bacterium]